MNNKTIETFIEFDTQINSFLKIKRNLTEALISIKCNMQRRVSEILIENGVGYREINNAKNSVPYVVANTSTSYLNGIEIITFFSDGNSQDSFFFSKPLGIYIKGKPNKDSKINEYYKKITGEEIC